MAGLRKLWQKNKNKKQKKKKQPKKNKTGTKEKGKKKGKSCLHSGARKGCAITVTWDVVSAWARQIDLMLR